MWRLTHTPYESRPPARPSFAQRQQQQHYSRAATASNFPVAAARLPNEAYGPQPWTAYTCAPCSTERDCRSPFEYCSPSGCCMPGECASDQDCAHMDASETYYKINNFESMGGSINSLHPQDNMYVTRKACDVNPDCVGYNSYGYLKHSIQPPSLWYSQPPVKDLPPWALYIKKSALEGENPQIKLPHGVKNYCMLAPVTKESAAAAKKSANFLMGVCRQCLKCKSDGDCPDSTVCDEATQCCVNNPCYVATPEYGKWIDGHYSREPQCGNCKDDEPYCCLADHRNPLSGYCSKQPCSTQNQVRACSYICEDPTGKSDAVMCKANQRCCNMKGGAPQCCAPGYDCAPNGNGCVKDEARHTCSVSGYAPLTCFGSQVCCNSDKTRPPSCCSEACSSTGNMCSSKEKLA